ncbi:MAG: hypothetical protein JJU13_16555 [Balneolaceae bacterium]|nr:hypothetical protein [Balneolaceae bacterium]
MNYFGKQDFVIKGLKLKHDGYMFDGHGFMEWHPDNGFELKLFVENDQYKPSKNKKFGGYKIIKDRDRTDVNLMLDGYKRAIVPSINIINTLSFEIDRVLQLKCNRLLFFEDIFVADGEYWTGGALYRITNSNYNFPDTLKRITKHGDTEVERCSEAGGIYYENQHLQIRVRKERKEYLRVTFKISKEKYSQQFALKFPCGLQTALTFILGETVQRLRSEVDCENSTVIEVFKISDVKRLKNYQALQSFKNFNSELLVNLSEFFTFGYISTEKYTESYVGKLILSQLVEAENQISRTSQELLTATILEAALRTIYGVPFLEEGKSKFDVSYYLKNEFIPQYSDGKKWRVVRKEVIKAFERMRHRNAHPDWLIKEDDVYSDNRASDTYLDLRIMIKFYQQMILLMAGIKDVKPELPNKI